MSGVSKWKKPQQNLPALTRVFTRAEMSRMHLLLCTCLSGVSEETILIFKGKWAHCDVSILQIHRFCLWRRARLCATCGKKVKICCFRVYWPTPTPQTSRSAWITAQLFHLEWTWPLTPGRAFWFGTFTPDTTRTTCAAAELEEFRECQRRSQ